MMGRVPLRPKNREGVVMERPSEVQFEVVVRPEPEGRSMYGDDAMPGLASLDAYVTPVDKGEEVARKLQRHGVTITHMGKFSISASCGSHQFEQLFSTQLSEINPHEESEWEQDWGVSYFAPRQGERWALPTEYGLDSLIEKAYIQPPPLLFAGERPVPPFWNDKFRLRVPGDVAQLMNATSVHRKGLTGKGVRVAMVDTGFYHHPYFKDQGYNFLSVTAPDAIDPYSDDNGHGTGESANLFATAPGINFIGVKYGGNLTLAFKSAMDLDPQVITNSWGYHMDVPGSAMPNFLKPLHLAVLQAVKQGICICFSAGNGHYAFPGSMPEVISVGGVHVTESLEYEASNYSSGFSSTWFPGRKTPDICGLVGSKPTADYITLPVQKNTPLDKPGAAGWGAFSGTSAASPMVAGVCAVLLQQDPSLRPEQIKRILQYTARDIIVGKNIHNQAAMPGPDDATGYGLVDAARAMEVLQ